MCYFSHASLHTRFSAPCFSAPTILCSRAFPPVYTSNVYSSAFSYTSTRLHIFLIFFYFFEIYPLTNWKYGVIYISETDGQRPEQATRLGWRCGELLKTTKQGIAFYTVVSCHEVNPYSAVLHTRADGNPRQFLTSMLPDGSSKALKYFGNGRGSRRASGLKHVPLSGGFRTTVQTKRITKHRYSHGVLCPLDARLHFYVKYSC